MKLKYKARTKEGELQVGIVEAVTREAALNTLSGHDLFILSLEEADDKQWYERILNFINRVRTKDLMVFTRQFATMLAAKVPLTEALRVMQKQTGNIILKETIFEVASDVDAGLSLSQSMEKYSNIFSVFYVNMIRSAEITGRMEEATNFLADYLEKQDIIISKVRNALIYPVVMVVLFLAVAGLMAIVVFPGIEQVFEQAGIELPFFTKLMISSGNFLANWWWAVIAVIVLVSFLVIDYFQTKEGAIVFDEMVLRLPVFGNLLKKLYVARFAESASILIKGGIPIAQTLEITGHTLGSMIYQDMLHETAEDVRKGELMSQSLAKHEEYFPPLVAQMVAIGETTGRLEELLERVSNFYTREVDNLVNNLVELVQPALIIVIGAMVGVLFYSILKPIYDLTQSYQSL